MKYVVYAIIFTSTTFKKLFLFQLFIIYLGMVGVCLGFCFWFFLMSAEKEVIPKYFYCLSVLGILLCLQAKFS